MYFDDLRTTPEAWHTLEERARTLAAQEHDDATDLGEEILVFQLGEGTYGIPADCVHEVQPLSTFTPLPATPPFVIGLVNIRGRLFTALDIRPLLDIPSTPPQVQSFLLRISGGGVDVSLLADSVVEVRHSDPELSPSLSATAGRGVSWVRGVDSRLTVQIDPVLLLTDPRLIVNDTSD
ncbi:MAG: hypothetical protein RLZZ387_2257 [Chloroflexota bacterium]|jgi:purine-binding chemotaxis protein CheW